jgi:epsilon-lactone hydrolase
MTHSHRISWQARLLRAALAFQKKRRRGPLLPAASVRRRLRLLERFVPGPPKGTVTTAVDAAGINVVRVKVRAARPDRYVLFFHGGGYMLGTARLYRDFMWRIGAAARAIVYFFEYRLAPEHPFPMAIEDAVKVCHWLFAQADARRIAFLGDSAGGGLLLATLHKLRDEGAALPAAAIALSPWTDLALTGDSLRSNADADPMMVAAHLPAIAQDYLAGADPRNSYASPLHGDPAGFPPTLLHVGSDEILRDDAVRMAEKIQAAGCTAKIEVWQRMPHCWHLYARILPEARQALDRIGAFLQSTW